MKMDKQIFSVFDSKVGYYLKPFDMRSKGEALRAFVDLVNDKNTAVGKHPEDYVLFHLGSFNELDGKFVNLNCPVSLGVGTEFIKNGDENIYKGEKK